MLDENQSESFTVIEMTVTDADGKVLQGKGTSVTVGGDSYSFYAMETPNAEMTPRLLP